MNIWNALIPVISLASILVSLPAVAAKIPLSQDPSRVLYQIYIESFKDSQADGKGDLAGLVSKLDYLKNLGISGLLVMPVFESDDGMGYIPKDFYAVRSDYAGKGSPEERERVLARFIDEAHARGMQVYLDAPINHISLQSTWFKNSAGKVPGFENHFLWADHPLEGWRIPWEPSSTPKDVWHLNRERNAYFYALFGWGMPEFNHRNPAVVSLFDDFFEHYAALGVDGFRIDAAKHLIEGDTNTVSFVHDNIPLLKHYLEAVRTRFPQISFLLEVWSGYDEIEAFPLTSGDVEFDFPYMGSLRDSLKFNHPYGVRNTLQHFMRAQNTYLPGNRIVFAGNHDVPRLRTLSGNDAQKSELGLALTLTLPYVPMIYYGDEIFMEGDYIRYPKTPDKNLNEVCMPMLWTPELNAGFTSPTTQLGAEWNKRIEPDWQEINVQTQAANSHSYLNAIRRLIQARLSLNVTNGVRFFVERNDDSDPVVKTAMVFEDGSCTVGLYNFSTSRQNARTITYPGVCAAKASRTLVKTRAYQRNPETLDMDPYGYWVGVGQFTLRH
ncbi:MAG TPA: hypothetical protein DCS07_11215 [Bdellovibrionales bacterium]|nr:MAG: hypothetical protein A2070_02285 [Bdellovibrionales bacterium GWC1_52_8]HAR43177.1 hypothetical protein [Bdellovibrionales bacterium]